MKEDIKNIQTNNSEIFIGSDVFKVLTEYLTSYKKAKKILLVDENTMQHCVSTLISQVPLLKEVEIIEINSGEENKTLDICYQIWKTLSDFNADRNTLLINLGGGVITDMGGFIASTYKRGIDFINIPTTLLAQVDASVGGKVGVDFDGLKNMIGLFNEPEGVFIYPPFLNTLNKRQILSGYAEILKHALIVDKNYWNDLKNNFLADANKWADMIERSVIIKNTVVLSDPEEKNQRKLLNFGHTIGHALESYSLTNEGLPLLHGEAIAIGMICESYISTKEAALSNNELEEISETLLMYYPNNPLESAKFHQFISLMKNDKKNKNNKINFTLLDKIGKGKVDIDVDINTILDSLTYYNSLLEKPAS